MTDATQALCGANAAFTAELSDAFFKARLTDALTAPVFTMNPALVEPFREMCEKLRDEGAFTGKPDFPAEQIAREIQRAAAPAPVDGDISDAEMFARDLQFHGETGDGWQDEEDTDAHDSHGYDPAYDD